PAFCDVRGYFSAKTEHGCTTDYTQDHPRIPDHANLGTGAYELRPIVQIGLGEFAADLWLYRTRQDDGSVLHEFDVTLDGATDAGGLGLGDSHERPAPGQR